MKLKALLLAAATLAVASPALATTPIPAGDEVQYTFNGVFPGFGTPPTSASFVVDSATFITAPDMATPVSCTGCGTATTVLFFPGLGSQFDEITVNRHVTTFSVTTTDLDATFDTIGTFTASNNTSTLNVAFVELPGSAAPEPVTWSLMVGGFCTLGATLRRRRTADAKPA